MGGLQVAFGEELPTLFGPYHDLVPNPNQEQKSFLLLKGFQGADSPKAGTRHETKRDLGLVQDRAEYSEEVLPAKYLGRNTFSLAFDKF